MRHIDAFCHFFPPRLFEKMSRTAGGTKDIGKRIQGVRTIYDLDARLKMMDEFDDYAEILSLGLPPLDAMAGPQEAAEFARVANDGLAELCAKHPDRFAGYVGALPMNAPEAAAKEAERILIHGNAIQAKARSPPFIARCSSTAPATSAPCRRRRSASTPMPFSPSSAMTKLKSPSCARRR